MSGLGRGGNVAPSVAIPTAHGGGWTLRTTQRILTVIAGVLGLLLIGKAVFDGLWPISLQLVAGILLIVYTVVRWRQLR